MIPSDRELILRVLERDADAFEVLFCRYGEMVSGHLLRMVRSRAVADDLVQEVFLRVWNRADRWRREGTFKAWLFRVATNLALNYLRSVKRRREQPFVFGVDVDEGEEESMAPGWMIDNSALGPDAVLEQAEQRRLLHGLIEALPEEKREVFRLVHDAEMEMQEVAERLGIPEGTVKSRMHHARKSLARGWKEIETEWEDQ